MWIEVETTATVTYICNLNEEDTKKCVTMPMSKD